MNRNLEQDQPPLSDSVSSLRNARTAEEVSSVLDLSEIELVEFIVSLRPSGLPPRRQGVSQMPIIFRVGRDRLLEVLETLAPSMVADFSELWRAARPLHAKRLDGGERDLPGADLSRAYLLGAVIERAQLRDALFAHSCLDRSKWRDCDLQRATFDACRLDEIDFSGSDLRGSVFSNVLGQMERASFQGCTLQAATARAVRFVETSFVRANLRTAELAGSNFRKCQMSGADLSEASLSGARIDGCECDGASFRRARLDAARFECSTFSGADFTDVDLSKVHLAYSRLTNLSGIPRGVPEDFAVIKASSGPFIVGPRADLHSMDLSRLSLSGLKLTSANFRGASLVGADLSHATLLAADLRNTNLQGARLQKANLGYAKMESTVLKEAILDEATFQGCNLSTVDFSRALMGQEQFQKLGLANRYRWEKGLLIPLVHPGSGKVVSGL